MRYHLTDEKTRYVTNAQCCEGECRIKVWSNATTRPILFYGSCVICSHLSFHVRFPIAGRILSEYFLPALGEPSVKIMKWHRPGNNLFH